MEAGTQWVPLALGAILNHIIPDMLEVTTGKASVTHSFALPTPSLGPPWAVYVVIPFTKKVQMLVFSG